ncbi:MAG TPA: hypothetical protein VG755_15285 [Nannocystaceae bacterium]|nr:hypothetical protein [Nannocystaceae bacterium]
MTRGLARQWAAQLRAPLPEALWLVGACPRWLAALVRARSFAAADPIATATLDAIDRELALVTGVAEPRWPTRLRTSAPPKIGPDLQALDPSQVLVVCAGLRRASDRTRAAIESLLAASFGGHESEWSADMRARLCTSVFPDALRPRWRAGLGLSPPDAVAPGAHHGGIRMLAAALEGTDVRAVDEVAFAPLRTSAAIDLLMTALSIRAALRCSGDLPRVVVPCDEPTVITRAPAALAVAA